MKKLILNILVCLCMVGCEFEPEPSSYPKELKVFGISKNDALKNAIKKYNDKTQTPMNYQEFERESINLSASDDQIAKEFAYFFFSHTHIPLANRMNAFIKEQRASMADSVPNIAVNAAEALTKKLVEEVIPAHYTKGQRDFNLTVPFKIQEQNLKMEKNADKYEFYEVFKQKDIVFSLKLEVKDAKAAYTQQHISNVQKMTGQILFLLLYLYLADTLVY